MDWKGMVSKVASMPQVQNFIKELVFPVAKQNIVDKAKQKGVDNNIMSLLQKLPDKQYQSQDDVVNELQKVAK
jgi:hypothetical protein